jgi:hypothetical protein
MTTKIYQALKRVQQIAKAGYTIEDKSHMHTWHGYQDKETQSFVYEWLLTANAERLKIIEAEDKEEEKKRLEAEAYRKTPEARIRRIKSEIYQAESVTAVIGAKGFHMVTPEERASQIRELQKELSEVEKEIIA